MHHFFVPEMHLGGRILPDRLTKYLKVAIALAVAVAFLGEMRWLKRLIYPPVSWPAFLGLMLIIGILGLAASTREIHTVRRYEGRVDKSYDMGAWVPWVVVGGLLAAAALSTWHGT